MEEGEEEGMGGFGGFGGMPGGVGGMPGGAAGGSFARRAAMEPQKVEVRLPRVACLPDLRASWRATAGRAWQWRCLQRSLSPLLTIP